MGALDYIIIALVAAWFLAALRSVLKKKGGCCSCGSSCPAGKKVYGSAKTFTEDSAGMETSCAACKAKHRDKKETYSGMSGSGCSGCGHKK